MKTRILRVEARVARDEYFVPQRKVGEQWLEYIGYDKPSTVIRVMIFDTLPEAEAFLKNPSIYKTGLTPNFSIEVVE